MRHHGLITTAGGGGGNRLFFDDFEIDTGWISLLGITMKRVASHPYSGVYSAFPIGSNWTGCVMKDLGFSIDTTKETAILDYTGYYVNTNNDKAIGLVDDLGLGYMIVVAASGAIRLYKHTPTISYLTAAPLNLTLGNRYFFKLIVSPDGVTVEVYDSNLILFTSFFIANFEYTSFTRFGAVASGNYDSLLIDDVQVTVI